MTAAHAFLAPSHGAMDVKPAQIRNSVGHHQPYNKGITFLLGAPRSGTTWLGKIFDSHPSVLYRHEPDIAAAVKLPFYVAEGEFTPERIREARRVIEAQIDRRTVKSACSLPVFRKEDDTLCSFAMRSSLAVTLKGLARVLPTRHALQLHVPKRFDHPIGRSHIVIKSVSSLGRANLLAKAVPEARFILLLRNAFGQVASYLQGIRIGSFRSDGPDARLMLAAAHPFYRLTENKLNRMSLVERLAWDWAVMNEKAFDDLADLPRTIVVRHGDLAENPILHAGRLLQFVELPWMPQVQTFVHRSSSSPGGENYYSVWKRSSEVSHRWQTYLTEEEKRQIRVVMQETRIGKIWPELMT